MLSEAQPTTKALHHHPASKARGLSSRSRMPALPRGLAYHRQLRLVRPLVAESREREYATGLLFWPPENMWQGTLVPCQQRQAPRTSAVVAPLVPGSESTTQREACHCFCPTSRACLEDSPAKGKRLAYITAPCFFLEGLSTFVTEHRRV